MAASHTAPRGCPVCGERLVVTRLGCESCGTEISGAFAPCQFCGLSAEDLGLLRVFLASRGNMKELERHLGVSYPTARARFDAVLRRAGIEPAGSGDGGAPADADRMSVLEALARGDVDVDTALEQL